MPSEASRYFRKAYSMAPPIPSLLFPHLGFSKVARTPHRLVWRAARLPREPSISVRAASCRLGYPRQTPSMYSSSGPMVLLDSGKGLLSADFYPQPWPTSRSKPWLWVYSPPRGNYFPSSQNKSIYAPYSLICSCVYPFSFPILTYCFFHAENESSIHPILMCPCLQFVRL